MSTQSTAIKLGSRQNGKEVGIRIWSIQGAFQKVLNMVCPRRLPVLIGQDLASWFRIALVVLALLHWPDEELVQSELLARSKRNNKKRAFPKPTGTSED